MNKLLKEKKRIQFTGEAFDTVKTTIYSES